MKEYTSEFLIAGVCLAVIVAVVVVICVGCHETEQTNREKVKAGLVEKETMGPTTHWTKP